METKENLSLAEKIKEAVRKAKEPFLERQTFRNPHKTEIVTLEGEVTSVGKIMEANPKGKPLDAEGREVFDPTPVAPPVGYVKQPSLFEQVRDMVRGEALRLYADAQDMESFEEADDFDVDDDYDPRTPYEQTFEGSVQNDWEKLKEAPPSKAKSKKKSGADDQSAPPVSDPAKPGGSADPKDPTPSPAPKSPA